MTGNARIAYCGLYCPLCSFDVAAETGDRAHLEAMPEKYDHLKLRPLEECSCIGCRDQVDNCHCDMKPCAEKRGHLTCADCGDFPCESITNFGNDGMPHHRDALQNLWRIKEVGYDRWLLEMEELTGRGCGKRWSWYHTGRQLIMDNE